MTGTRQHSLRIACLLVICSYECAGAAVAVTVAAQASTLQEVVVTAPLPGSEAALNQIAANVQQLTAAGLDAAATDASDALNRLAGSVSLNDTQGNPFQPDVNFRGFTASPVLGTPQGVSVFVDGVRVNEVFGDVVNWDLIPQSAIGALDIIPGSDPLFGLNTLGGAISVRTKRGFDFPGTRLELYGGSFGRHAEELETGGHGGRLDYFLTGNLFDERGWGEDNPSRVRQAFGKVGYRDQGNDVTLAFTYADNRLEGNQTLPRSFLSDPGQAYTWPDIQTDQMSFIDLNASHRFAERWTLSATLYDRAVDTGVINSNVNDDFDVSVPIGPGNEPTGNALEHIEQERPGAALQLAGRAALAGHDHTLLLGASTERGSTQFQELEQEADARRDTASTAPAILATRLHAVTRNLSVYFNDTVSVAPGLFLALGGRYNRAGETLEDRLGTALDGQQTFSRFDPVVGLTFNPARALTLYASYDEGMRVPTPIELTCADPAAPCSLPNAFSADPPLKAVIARSVEIGARGSLAPGLKFTAALFHTALVDDLQFVASGGGAVSSGYFENVGRTLRSGLELGLEQRAGALSWGVQYSYLRATYEAPFTLNSPDNSTAAPLTCAECTEIAVVPGNRIPGIPRHVLKLRAAYSAGRAGIGIDVLGQSSAYARGDENNRDANGPVPGFLLVNLAAHYDLSSCWRLFARIDNLLDRRYYSYGQLGLNVFTLPANRFDASGQSWRAEQFRTVGAPIGAWLGVVYHLHSATDHAGL